jgi:hypothetical protein
VQGFEVRAPLSDVLTQPFEGHNRSIENEAEYSGKFYAAAAKFSPEVQPWLYSQWPTVRVDGAWSEGKGANKGLKGVVEQGKGGDYAVAAENHLRYFEAVRDRINASWKGKPVRIVPTARAMSEAKKAVEGGKVPGLTNFGDFYSDDLHLSGKGRWFVANVVMACLTGESPVGKSAVLSSGLTEEQAKVLQGIAWEVVRQYEFSGVRREQRK